MSSGSPVLLTLACLSAMVLAAPIAKRLGLGAVLGYLIAGSLLGPHVMGILGSSQEEVKHLAEFGVIMMLFLIGLELKPSLLWKLRGPIFGLGGLQMALTTAAFAGVALALHFPWQLGLAGGTILALSSTAIVLQTLQEKGLLKTTGGENAFSVLLFQDIAVIPILALFPFLASSLGVGASSMNAAPALSPVMHFLQVLGAVASVIIAGRLLLRPIFRLVAGSQIRELSTAVALLVILSVTLLMNAVGLSPALGAFLAGVVLADSEYRHQLEADIEPFKGLLLAVFFISIGAEIDYSLLAKTPGAVGAAVLGIVLIKGLLLFGLARLARLAKPEALLFSVSLAQGGEFAFVLLGYSRQLQLFSTEASQFLIASIALSMGIAPLLINGYAKWIEPLFATPHDEREADTIDERNNPVIIAGFGRFGQMVARLLRGCGIRATILDYDTEQVEIVRKFGSKAFYGDASRMDLLHSAGAAQAKLFVIAIDDRDKTTEIVEQVQKEFPNLKMLVRVYDRIHAYELINRGIENVYVETAGSALNLGIDALTSLGFRPNQAVQLAKKFNHHNNESIRELAKIYEGSDEATFIHHAKSWLAALEKTLQSDQFGLKAESDRAWESPPRPKTSV